MPYDTEKSHFKTDHCENYSENSHVAPIIGYHRAPLSQKFGAPRQPNLVALMSVIEMLAPYDTPAAFVGLEDFSHIWLSWQFHHNFINKASSSTIANDHKFRAQVRPPRLGGNQKIGVFASRSMYRPSGLGLSVVKLERIEVVDGRVLLMISGADMIDGTPIIDIKPYVAYSDAHINADSGFAPDAPAPLMVTITDKALEKVEQIIASGQDYNDRSDCNRTNHKGDNNKGDNNKGDNNKGDNNKSDSNKHTDKKSSVANVIYNHQTKLIASDMEHIMALIAQDPRPAYRKHELNHSFVMRYKAVDVSFQLITEGQLQITNVSNIN